MACAVLALALLTSAQASAECPVTEYQSKPLVLGCSGGNGTLSLELSNLTSQNLGSVPAGYTDFEIQLISTSDNRMRVQLRDAGGACVVGEDCLLNTSCDNASQFCHEHQGMLVSYAKQSFPVGVEEWVRLKGVLMSSFGVEIALERWSRSVSVGRLHYAHQGTLECPKPLPGCTRCRDYQGCAVNESPTCRGGQEMPFCSSEPMLPEKQDWFEMRFSPPVGATSNCECCHLPVEDGPVKVGLGLAVSNSSAQVTLTALHALFRWVNQERGGLCVNSSNGTSRRRAELLVLDTQQRPELSRAAVQRLALDHGVELFLGLEDVDAMADMAQRLQALLLAPVAASDALRCDFCFGLAGAPRRFLAPALALVAAKAPGRRSVGYLQAEDAVSRETCSAVRNLTAAYGMDLIWAGESSNLTSSGLQADVLILCTQQFTQCLDFIQAASETSATAIVVSGPCVSSGLLQLPHGGFVLGVAPRDLWASYTPNTVDAGYQLDGQDFSGLLKQIPGLEDSEDLQLQAEMAALASGRHLAALHWAAAAVLLTAAQGGSAEAAAEYLASLQPGDLQTIVGPVHFGGDRQGAAGAVVVQSLLAEVQRVAVSQEGLVCTFEDCFDATGAALNSSSSLDLQRAVLPLPPQADRECFRLGPTAFGFLPPPIAVCGPCGSQVSLYDPELQRRFCQSCTEAEFLHTYENGTGACLPCASNVSCPGQRRLNCGCAPCPPNTFGAGDGRCEDCPVGQFSAPGTLACSLCPAGKSSAGAGECVNCTAGTFSISGTCSPCPSGTVADLDGATECAACAPGHRSSWDAASCEPCPEGSFQPEPNASECLDAVEGADFQGAGLVTGVNQEGFWTRRHRPLSAPSVSWEPCRVPGACLRNERCAVGACGAQCQSCLPGHVPAPAFAFGSTCVACPSGPQTPLVLGLFAVLILWLAMWLARLGLTRQDNPKDLRLGYVKILLLYGICCDALATTAIEMLSSLQTSLGLELTSLLAQGLSAFAPSAFLRGAARCGADWAVRRLGHVASLEAAASSFVAGDAGAVPSAAMHWESLAEALKGLRHSTWFQPESLDLREQLKDYQSSVELCALLFWLCAPLALAFLAFALCLGRVAFVLRRAKAFYARAAEFYEELVQEGTKQVLAQYDAEDWLAFSKAYFQRLAWLWNSDLAQEEGVRDFLKAFGSQGRPLLLALLLVLYGYVLDGLLELCACLPLLPQETLRRVTVAPELPCWGLMGKLASGLALLWALGVPVLLSNQLRKVRNELPDDFEFPPAFCVLSFGYRLGCWNWEMYVFLLKAGILVSLRVLGPSGRSSFLFLLAVLHGFVSRAFGPFTARSDFALVKADNRFALFFVGQSILVQVLAVSSTIPIVMKILAVSLVAVMLCLNLLMVLSLLRACLACWQDTFIESYEFYEWALWRDGKRNRRCLGLSYRLTNLLLRRYKRRVRQRAYVSFDSRRGWLTVCGSHGDAAMAVANLAANLSQAPAVPVPEVQAATSAQRRKVQKYLQHTAERLCLIKGCPTFSVLELEFIIRAAFVFARRAELARSKLTKQLSLISREESFMGMDALQLLWDSMEADGAPDADSDADADDVPAAARGRKSTFARRTRKSTFARQTRESTFARQSQASTYSEYSMGPVEPTESMGSSYEPLSASVRKRFRTSLLTESFFNDPTKVLFFYSRVEFIRQAEMRKAQSNVRNRLSTIPTERTAAMDQCFALMRWLWATLENLPARMQGRSVEKPQVEVLQRRTAMRSNIIGGGLDVTDPVMQEMFSEETFARGLELQDFQMGLIVVEHTKDADLKLLQDAFHDRWFQHRLLVEHDMRMQQGHLKDQGVQADAEEELGEQYVQGEPVESTERPTVEDLRWMRLIMKAGGGIFKEKVMPSMREINELLRTRTSVFEASGNISDSDASGQPLT